MMRSYKSYWQQAVGSADRVHTFKVMGKAPPFYRAAEVLFDDLEALKAFMRQPGSDAGRESSEAVSTGGPPLFLVLEQDGPA